MMSADSFFALLISALAAGNFMVGLKFGVAAIHGSTVKRTENPRLFYCIMGISAFALIACLLIAGKQWSTDAPIPEREIAQEHPVQQHFIRRSGQ
jgi:hypothetical protein